MISIKTIWESHKPAESIIEKTKLASIKHLNCYAATNHITGQHLYIMSVSKIVAIPELKNYHFKGVQIFTIETENNIELSIYLLDNELKDIFSLFIQNMLLRAQLSRDGHNFGLTISFIYNVFHYYFSWACLSIRKKDCITRRLSA